MAEDIDVDLCVVGAGAAGLTVAAGASQLGASVVLVERASMGGECLNSGCVPSKALLASAEAAAALRRAPLFGIAAGPVQIDFAAVRRHVEATIATIAPNDSAERFAGLGVRVIKGQAAFVSRDRIEVQSGPRVRARRFVLATGSRPFLPEIPCLDPVPLLTNETIFDLPVLPGHLLVLGAGPVGVELALAFRRLGAEVTLIEPGRPLGGFDAELAEIHLDALRDEGVRIAIGAAVTEFSRDETGPLARLDDGELLSFTHVLAATGRRVETRGLGLDVAGIVHGPNGIVVDRSLRTSNRRVYAIGDAAATGPRLTHAAAHQATLVLRNALFRQRIDWRRAAVPSVVYGPPELAQVGLDETAAMARHGKIHVLRWPFAENDRARTDLRTDGLVKVVTDRRGRILGAGIVGAQAGELILPWVLAVAEGLSIRAMAGIVAPYPTLGEASKRAAGSFFTGRLFSERTRRIVRALIRLG
jgi:pyruvate/2-oxoglutarate dehydrogenase complex dihydrolipoamide dehydrogenase (E3) component